MLDPFKADGFSLLSLTAAINNLPFIPTQVAEMGIFEEQGITTLSAAIEFDGTTVGLVDVRPRDADPKPVTNDKRRLTSVMIPHLPQRATILADEVQGVRAFGSDSQAETIERVRDRRLMKMRTQIDYTMEAHRIAAIKGGYYDANGVVTSLFTLFGVAQQTVEMALDTVTTKTKGKALTIIEKVESAMDGLMYTDLVVLCGSSFWRKFIEHDSIEATYLNTSAAAELRGDPRDSFPIHGLTWRRYRGTSVCKIEDNCAYVIPIGVADLFLTRFAPANYMETVNTEGLPYYAKSEPMPMNKGLDLEAQSNPLNLCTRPNAIIKLWENTAV